MNELHHTSVYADQQSIKGNRLFLDQQKVGTKQVFQNWKELIRQLSTKAMISIFQLECRQERGFSREALSLSAASDSGPVPQGGLRVCMYELCSYPTIQEALLQQYSIDGVVVRCKQGWMYVCTNTGPVRAMDGQPPCMHLIIQCPRNYHLFSGLVPIVHGIQYHRGQILMSQYINNGRKRRRRQTCGIIDFRGHRCCDHELTSWDRQVVLIYTMQGPQRIQRGLDGEGVGGEGVV